MEVITAVLLQHQVISLLVVIHISLGAARTRINAISSNISRNSARPYKCLLSVDAPVECKKVTQKRHLRSITSPYNPSYLATNPSIFSFTPPSSQSFQVILPTQLLRLKPTAPSPSLPSSSPLLDVPRILRIPSKVNPSRSADRMDVRFR